jgi:hypothetical protein
VKAVLVQDNIVIAISDVYPGMKLNKGWLTLKSEREANLIKVGEFYNKPKYKITVTDNPVNGDTTQARRNTKK